MPSQTKWTYFISRFSDVGKSMELNSPWMNQIIIEYLLWVIYEYIQIIYMYHTNHRGLSWGRTPFPSHSEFHRNRPASTSLDPRTITYSLISPCTTDCTQPVISMHLLVLPSGDIQDPFLPTCSSRMNHNSHIQWSAEWPHTHKE